MDTKNKSSNSSDSDDSDDDFDFNSFNQRHGIQKEDEKQENEE